MKMKCKRCGIWKNETKFYISKTNNSGRHYTCKKCQDRKEPVLMDELNGYEYVVEETKILLERLGYDLSKNIHNQFKQKVKVKYGVSLE